MAQIAQMGTDSLLTGIGGQNPDSPDGAQMGPMSVLTGIGGKTQIAQMGPRRGPCRYIWGICGNIPVCPDEADVLFHGQILIIGRLSPDSPDGAQKGPVRKSTGTFWEFCEISPDSPDGAQMGPVSVLTGIGGQSPDTPDGAHIEIPSWAPPGTHVGYQG